MTWIDFAIGLLLILEVFRGWKNGFSAEAGAIIGIILGFIIASTTGNTLSEFLFPAFNESMLWSRIFSFLLTFLAVFVLILILSKIFEGFLKVFALDWMNKVAGVVFCFLRGVLVLSIVLNIYQRIDKDSHLLGAQRVSESKLYTPIKHFAPAIFPSLKLFQNHREPKDLETKLKNE